MKKRLIAITALLAIATQVFSCGGTSADPQTQDDLTTTSSTETTPAPNEPDIPVIDCEGYTLRFATYTDNNGEYFYVEESDGDVVNDAVYESTSAVMENYNANIELVFYGASYNDVKTFTETSVQAGDDAFDLVHGHDCTMWQMSLGGLFKNIRELKYQNFDKPWWPLYANDAYEINGKQYIFSSYISYQSLAWARALFINKTIAEEFSLDIPYETVKNGDWTLDEFLKMAKSVYRDLNGNNIQDEEDIYGFVGYKKLYGFQSAFVNCYSEGDDGKVSIDYDRERFVDVVERMNQLMNGGEGGYLTGDEPDSKMFSDGKALFFYNTLDTLSQEAMRESDIDYGILPVPKYDSEQENYITPSFDCQFAIPVTVSDPDTISLLVEALSASGYNNVRDVYFETALSTKYTRDEGSIEMLNIIGDTLTVDLSYLNTSAGINGLGRALMYCLSNPDKGIVSYLDSIEASEQAIIDKLNEFFGE